MLLVGRPSVRVVAGIFYRRSIVGDKVDAGPPAETAVETQRHPSADFAQQCGRLRQSSVAEGRSVVGREIARAGRNKSLAAIMQVDSGTRQQR